MSEKQSEFWFPAMRFGWGWGLPVKWQGWVVLVGYFGLILTVGKYFRPGDQLPGFLISVAVATVLLLAIVFLKGEKPPAWRWGKK